MSFLCPQEVTIDHNDLLSAYYVLGSVYMLFLNVWHYHFQIENWGPGQLGDTGQEGTKLGVEARAHNKKIIFKSLSFVVLRRKSHSGILNFIFCYSFYLYILILIYF